MKSRAEMWFEIYLQNVKNGNSDNALKNSNTFLSNFENKFPNYETIYRYLECDSMQLSKVQKGMVFGKD